MRKYRYFYLLPILAASQFVMADWQLVEDFSGNLDNWFFSDPNQNCESLEPNFCDGVREIITDPVNGADQVGSFKAAADNVTANWTAVNAVALPESITDGKTYTFYTKFAIRDFRQDTAFGLMSVPADVVTNGYGDFETIIRIHFGQGGLLQLRDFDQYLTFNQDPVQNNQWYELWMVCDNANLTYDVYVKGPSDSEYPQQTLAYEGALNRAGTGTVHSFAILQSTQGPDNPAGNNNLYLDDMYLDTAGENLDSPDGGGPVGSTWAGYSVLPSGDTDTGTFAGWIYVGSEPYSGYVYSYSLSGWLYLPQDGVSSNGGWAYVFK